MSTSTTQTLANCIERARKVLQYEQRTNHQDQAIKPGGVELFVVRWADEAATLLKDAGLDVRPVYRFTEYLEGYRQARPAPACRQPACRPFHPERNCSISCSHCSGSEAVFNIIPGHHSLWTSLLQQETKSAPKTPPNAIRLEAGMSAGHTVLTLLSADITAVPGVGPTVAARLHNLGIRTVRDLLFYFPREHRDYSKLTKIAQIPFNELTTTMGLIWEAKNAQTGRGRTRTIATISDETGKMSVTWFNQPYLLKQLKASQGSYLVVTGTKQRFGNKVEFTVRSHEFPEQGDLLNTGRLVPTYPLTEGLNAKTLRKMTKWVVDHYAGMLPDPLPGWIRMEGKLMPLPDAVSHIHYPENEAALISARRRLGFDELFLIQLGMQERRSRWQHEAPQGNGFEIDLAKICIDAPPDDATLNGTGKHEKQADEAASLSATLWMPVVPAISRSRQRCLFILPTRSAA